MRGPLDELIQAISLHLYDQDECSNTAMKSQLIGVPKWFKSRHDILMQNQWRSTLPLDWWNALSPGDLRAGGSQHASSAALVIYSNNIPLGHYCTEISILTMSQKLGTLKFIVHQSTVVDCSWQISLGALSSGAQHWRSCACWLSGTKNRRDEGGWKMVCTYMGNRFEQFQTCRNLFLGDQHLSIWPLPWTICVVDYQGTRVWPIAMAQVYLYWQESGDS